MLYRPDADHRDAETVDETRLTAVAGLVRDSKLTAVVDAKRGVEAVCESLVLHQPMNGLITVTSGVNLPTQ